MQATPSLPPSSHHRTSSFFECRQGCVSFASYALIISGVALTAMGALALYAPSPQSLSEFHNWYFFCNVIGRNQGMVFLCSGIPLLIIVLLGKITAK